MSKSSLKHKIFTSDVAQGISIITTLVVGAGTLFFFYHEIQKNKVLVTKLHAEIEELQNKAREANGKKV